jgi:hypothetical protein
MTEREKRKIKKKTEKLFKVKWMKERRKSICIENKRKKKK